jgi:hypothetical protein
MYNGGTHDCRLTYMNSTTFLHFCYCSFLTALSKKIENYSLFRSHPKGLLLQLLLEQ